MLASASARALAHSLAARRQVRPDAKRQPAATTSGHRAKVMRIEANASFSSHCYLVIRWLMRYFIWIRICREGPQAREAMAVEDDRRIRELEHTIELLEGALSSERQALLSEKQAHRRTMDEVATLADEVRRLGDSLISFRSEFSTFRDEFSSFVEGDRLARDKQFAQTMVIDVRAQRDRRFGHYDRVRNVALGMLLAMDAGIVTGYTIQQAAERLMIETPGYWLAPVQVALAAWISDNEELANRALMNAMAREPNKTALFFSLVLARHERDNATAKWMREYLDRQDPMNLSREFTVVLDAAAQGTLGTSASQLAKERCIAWYEQLRSTENIVLEQSARWQQRISRNQVSISADFSVLPRISPDWAEMSKWLDAATALEQTEHWLRQRLETTVISQRGPSQRADEVLRKLVKGYDEEEDSLRQQERLWETVVKQGGDHTTAQRILQDDSPADESHTNFFDLLTTIGIAPETLGASDTTRQLAIRLADEWITAAAHGLSSASRTSRPRSVRVGIGKWTGELSVDGGDEEINRDFGRFVDQEVSDQLKLVTLAKPTSALVIMLIALGISVYELISHLSALRFLLVVTVVIFLLVTASSIWLRRAQQALPERREEVVAHGEKRKRQGQDRLREASAEVRQIFQRWEDKLAKEGSLVDFIHGQAAHANLLSLPPIEATGSGSDRFETPSSTEERARSLTASSDADADGSRVFAINLPHWDLLPPPRNIG